MSAFGGIPVVVSPYLPVGFMRLTNFDGKTTILSKSRERVERFCLMSTWHERRSGMRPWTAFNR